VPRGLRRCKIAPKPASLGSEHGAGGSLPSYYSQTNLGVSHRFVLPGVDAIKVRFDVINLFDEVYLLRGSTSLGAFSPAFGPRRTFYAGITKEF
jgi:outer membrane receptor protein involved in Fe transport